MTSTTGSALATAHRMSNRVHGHASNVWSSTTMPVSSGLADTNILMIQVSDLTNSGPALQTNHSQLTGGQGQMSPMAVLSGQAGDSTGGAYQLASTSGGHFDVVYFHSRRNSGQRHGISDLGLDLCPGEDLLADLQAQRSQDISLLTIGIVQASNMAGTVGVILDGSNLCGYVVFVAFEIDKAIEAFVSTAPVPRGNFAGVVAAAGLLERCQ